MAAERAHTFFIVRRDGKPQKIIVWDTQDISVGRAPENDVVLEDPESSRQHVVFYKADGGFTLKNFSMSNPTYVNGEGVPSAGLKTKDVVRVAETEFVFYHVTKNPVTLGLKVEYASQLKGFGPPMAEGDGEATILGLMPDVDSGDDEFVVRPARDFEHDLHGIPQPKARDLDEELADDGLVDPPGATRPASAPGVAAWTLENAPSDTLAVTLEITGLTAPQRASVEALLGKVVELPKLRIRIKGPDLG